MLVLEYLTRVQLDWIASAKNKYIHGDHPDCYKPVPSQYGGGQAFMVRMRISLYKAMAIRAPLELAI